MRIVHVITRMILGGAQENTLATATGQKVRHEVFLITGPETGPEGTLVPEAQAAGVRVIVEPSLLRDVHPFEDARCPFALERTIRGLRPDVLHTHSSKAGVHGRLAASWARVPAVVHTIHGQSFHPWQSRWRVACFRWLEQRLAARTDRLIAVGRTMVDQALAAGVGTPAQFTVIHSGFDVEAFRSPPAGARAEVRSALGIPPDAFVLGTIARLAGLKGHDALLSAIPDVARRHPRVRLLWVGDGPLRAALTAEAARLGVLDRIAFAGLVPRGRVPAFAAAMDALVHPSVREGLPRVVAQGFAAGLPAIAADSDGASEIVRDGETGFLAPPGDAVRLAAAMARLADDPALARRLGEAGRALVLPLFDEGRMVRRIEEVYEEALGAWK